MVFRKKQRGFSFGETLLATFVLSIGLLSVVKLFQVSVEKSIVLRDATVATGLAQEGMELIRSHRDLNMLSAGSATAFPFHLRDNNSWCTVSYQNNSTYACEQDSPLNNSQLYLDGSGYYTYYSANPSRFRRSIYVSDVQTDGSGFAQQVTYRSFVWWSDSSTPPSNGSPTGCSINNKCVYLEAILTDWKR